MKKLFLAVVMLIILGICTPIVSQFVGNWLNTDIGIDLAEAGGFDYFLAISMKFAFPIIGIVGIILWLVNKSDSGPDDDERTYYPYRRVKKLKKLE